jgi:enterochelin esterase-like enzyme
MKSHIRVLARLACVALTVLLLTACATPSASAPTPNAGTQWVMTQAALPTAAPKGRVDWRNEITSAALADNLLGDPATRTYHVYLPPSYSTGNTHYPVVYVLQGYTGGVDFYELTQRMDELIASNVADEMILVFFDGVNRYRGSWYLSSPTIGDYETFIAEELVSVVDSTYRTLPARDSRGITGCSMGGYGALHLALNYPDLFSVAAPMSAPYEWDHWLDTLWEAARIDMSVEPHDFDGFDALKTLDAQALVSLAAAAAPDPNRPPLYLDMPFRLVDGQPQMVPDVFQRIAAHDPTKDLQRYLDQPIRLRGLMIYQDTDLGSVDRSFAEAAGAFDKTLTGMGVEHEFVQVEAAHCYGDWAPILEFMSAHLAH